MQLQDLKRLNRIKILIKRVRAKEKLININQNKIIKKIVNKLQGIDMNLNRIKISIKKDNQIKIKKEINPKL